ncbi:site-specific integrase [Mesorhizobium sp.]|uniref:tyrosine-type recombinase/integrase n=1 Tax=Mesorhizobium sp. TaxID=1871066 RepID=UPI000FE61925|nr:site-specific integrase [Mesorhizobium sp.]RWO53701.1 MAG: site-specific integrase [Mesorhizobium sp.]TIN27065.1 MAG: site-specific integrase [Mesorhizobium sp.]TIN41641.1 MAG: site-specific integrase [Mesorhizobium sp.]TJU88523.1 MAG: site-specific integrase [Mesorhizobium sp.]TJU88950.1 MAG: site-specific integrase [Mesorhizobium sp.]
MATITKRKWTTGKGESREAWVLAYTDKKGNRHKEQFAKKRDADAKRVTVEGQIGKGTFRAEAASKTVKDAIDAYIKHLEKRHGKGEQVTTMYLRNTSGQLRTHVEPEIGATKLSDLTTRDIEELVDKLKDAEIGIPTIRRVVGALARTLRHAHDWVATNAAQGVRVTAKRGQGSEKVVPPSKAVLTAILKAAKDYIPEPPRGYGPEADAKFKKMRADSDLPLRIKFAAATGLRASEQWALRWRHIADGKVTVETRVDAFGEFDTTKSDAGVRTVPISKALAEDLSARRKASKHSGDEDFVFPDAFGGFTRHTNFTKRQWKPILEKAEVKDFGWHALRHFAVSTWIEAGLQPKTIQTLAGHATFAITMNRYGHMFPSDDHAEAMDKIAATLYAN